MAAFGMIFLALVSIALRAFVLVRLWLWFVTPFTHQRDKASEKADAEAAWESGVYSVCLSAVCLLTGWIFSHFV